MTTTVPGLAVQPKLPSDPQELIEMCRHDEDLRTIRALLGVYSTFIIGIFKNDSQ